MLITKALIFKKIPLFYQIFFVSLFLSPTLVLGQEIERDQFTGVEYCKTRVVPSPSRHAIVDITNGHHSSRFGLKIESGIVRPFFEINIVSVNEIQKVDKLVLLVKYFDSEKIIESSEWEYTYRDFGITREISAKFMLSERDLQFVADARGLLFRVYDGLVYLEGDQDGSWFSKTNFHILVKDRFYSPYSIDALDPFRATKLDAIACQDWLKSRNMNYMTESWSVADIPQSVINLLVEDFPVDHERKVVTMPNHMRQWLGDIGRDGSIDSVIELGFPSDAGGNFNVYHRWVISEYNEEPKISAKPEIVGFIREIEIVDEGISVETLVLQATDPRCCPTGRARSLIRIESETSE